MANSVCNSQTAAEQQLATQANLFQAFDWPLFATTPLNITANLNVRPQCMLSCCELQEQEFLLDKPLFAQLLPTLCASDAEATAQLLLVLAPPPHSLSAKESIRWLDALQDSVFGGGNILGNANSVINAATRKAYTTLASKNIKTLITQGGFIKLNENLTLESFRIGLDGVLGKNARLTLRVKKMPMDILNKLPESFNQVGRSANLRIPARDTLAFSKATLNIAEAQIQSSSLLRKLSSNKLGATLAIAPSFAMDFWDSYHSQQGAANISRDLAIRSARSQSGNAIGLATGIATEATALAVVGVASGGTVLLALGLGILAQTAWGSFGGDDWAEETMRDWLN